MDVILDPLQDFWTLNPQFAIIPEFRELLEKDRKSGSQIMWAIVLFSDRRSIYASLYVKEREKLIASDFLRQPKFKWKDVKGLISAYEKHILTAAKRALKTWEEKMLERDAFIRDTPYNAETAETLDKMMSSTKKLYEEYARVLSSLEDEGVTEKNKAGRESSLTEKGDI